MLAIIREVGHSWALRQDSYLWSVSFKGRIKLEGVCPTWSVLIREGADGL